MSSISCSKKKQTLIGNNDKELHKKVSDLNVLSTEEGNDLEFSGSCSMKVSNGIIIPASNICTKATKRSNNNFSVTSSTRSTTPKDLRQRHKIKFYSSLMECDYKEGDEFNWEPMNKGKVLSFKQWKIRVDTLLRHDELKSKKEEKAIIALKQSIPTLRHWMRKFRAVVDANGNKKLLAKKKMKKKTN